MYRGTRRSSRALPRSRIENLTISAKRGKRGRGKRKGKFRINASLVGPSRSDASLGSGRFLWISTSIAQTSKFRARGRSNEMFDCTRDSGITRDFHCRSRDGRTVGCKYRSGIDPIARSSRPKIRSQGRRINEKTDGVRA